MSFGDPDFKPNKAMKRQHLTQNGNMTRLAFKMRCKSCDARLVKESYYVDNSQLEELLPIYRDFYDADHYCKECGPGVIQSHKPVFKEKAIRYRGRGG